MVSSIQTTFYRPYEAAARFLLSPELVTKRQEGGISEQYLDPFAIMAGLREMQIELDGLIPLDDDVIATGALRMFLGTWE